MFRRYDKMKRAHENSVPVVCHPNIAEVQLGMQQLTDREARERQIGGLQERYRRSDTKKDQRKKMNDRD